MNSLIVKNLQFKYNKNLILDDVNIELKDGVVGLLGPNGAGKTTFMKLLVTLLRSNHGVIELNRLNYNNCKSIKEYIGYLPQNFDMYAHITGKDYLKFVASMKKVEKEELKNSLNSIIDLLNLGEFINKNIGSYSGGVKRRLGIAQALLGNAKLIILDEPTVGLDPEQRNEFRKILPIISKDKIVIISTHIVEDIEFNCDQLIILNKGIIKYNGNIINFLENSQTKLWTSVIDKEAFSKIDKSLKILEYRYVDNSIEVKYINDKPLFNNSIKVNPTLQDAYIKFIESN